MIVQQGTRDRLSPRFGVILPIYNGSKYIVQTLDALNSQNYRDFEVVIIDDGSNDSSVKIINDWIATKDPKNFNFYLNSKNIGLAKTLQTSLDKFSPSTTHLCLFAQDDLLPENYFKYASKQISKSRKRKISFFYPCLQFFNENDSKLGLTLPPIYVSPIKALTIPRLINSNYIASPGSIILKSEIKSEYFEKAFQSCQDWQLWLYLSLSGNFRGLPGIKIKYRRHQSNLSSAISNRDQHSDFFQMRLNFVNSAEFRKYFFSKSNISQALFFLITLLTNDKIKLCDHEKKIYKEILKQIRNSRIQKNFLLYLNKSESRKC